MTPRLACVTPLPAMTLAVSQQRFPDRQAGRGTVALARIVLQGNIQAFPIAIDQVRNRIRGFLTFMVTSCERPVTLNFGATISLFTMTGTSGPGNSNTPMRRMILVQHGIQHRCGQAHIDWDGNIGIDSVFHQGFSDVFAHGPIRILAVDDHPPISITDDLLNSNGAILDGLV